MIRLMTLILITAGPALAVASPCFRITKDAQRLACYDRIATCISIKDSKARLACMDKKMQNGAGGMRAGAAPKQVPTERDIAISEHAADVSNFGLAPKQLSHMSSTIASVKYRFDGTIFITLANHQVWRENSGDFDGFKVGQHVTIKPSIMGSFNLHLDHVNKLIKVQRVK